MVLFLDLFPVNEMPLESEGYAYKIWIQEIFSGVGEAISESIGNWKATFIIKLVITMQVQSQRLRGSHNTHQALIATSVQVHLM